jgi:hypothetical protein
MLHDRRVSYDALICGGYWRNSLADAELGRGAFRNDDVEAFVPVDSAAILWGQADAEAVAALFQGRHAEAKSRTVLLRPFVYRARTVHGWRRSRLPDVLTPIVSRVTLFRDGELTIPTSTVVPRDLLEPLDRNTLTIGTVEALDSFLTRFLEPSGLAEGEAESRSAGSTWAAYWRYCDRLAQDVFPALADDEQFERIKDGYIEAREQLGTSRSIGALYDHMRNDQPAAQLFSTFASRPLTEAEPCLEPHSGFADRLGHSSPFYALAEAQRNALTHMLAAEHGEVVAVNGPPGTGKTTLLLSVVASLWARAALDRGDAPIIFASSTNNQAVTNIIDAFGADFSEGEGPFAGRWLPNVTSFASYFPAPTREVLDTYLTQTFFDLVENADYLHRARSAFLRAAAIAFPDLQDLRVETVVEALHGKLWAQADVVAAIEAAWKALALSRERCRAALGDDPEAARDSRRREAEAAEEDNQRAQELGTTWDRHQAGEPLLQILLSWLAPVARKRLGGARAALRSHWPGPLPNWESIADIRPTIVAIAEEARAEATRLTTRLAEADALLQAQRACLERWCAALHAVGIDSGNAGGMTLAECDPLADRRLRFPIFLTTTHYWEGRWLIDMEAIKDLAKEKRRTGRGAMIPRWRRRMMLTPCAVATLYVLPNLMRTRRHDDGTFVSDYLYNTIDLLIVDEAGQVTPEVGGAAFALARRALVIGDTAQIEPIWNVPRSVDAGNLLNAGLLTSEDEQAGRSPFAESGRAASSGSVMRVAQHVSRYHQDPDLDRGLVLYEHRRCFDEIIGCCNDLCYRGKLQLLRGRKAGAMGLGPDGLPAMGYLQVDGLCEQLPGGSRHNIAEAETIAAWIADRKASLEQSYPERTLSEILGIVTPFAAQVQEIQKALGKAGINTEGRGVTVGSVHTFQGGQRPVMIFSPTYSKHADGSFIDMSTSMLNVAVSRAMNSFLVFGDLDCFSAAPWSSPRGQLGGRLFSAADNALTFSQAPRRDLIRRGKVEHLRDAAAHDAFLADVLARSRQEVQVVTPWLTQRALDESGLLPALTAAVARGIALTVYTDRMLNAQRAARDKTAVDDFACALETLREVGADLIKVCGVHSKILMADDDLFCAGSFNWFSAARDGAYARHETSLAYRGPAVAKEIEAMKASLQRRIAR